MKLTDKFGINCWKAHNMEAVVFGGELRYGTAIGPDGRAHHVWIRNSDGTIHDLFNWTDHEDMGGMNKDADEADKVVAYLRENGIPEYQWCGHNDDDLVFIDGSPMTRAELEAQAREEM